MDDIFINRGPHPQRNPRGLGPGLLLLLAAALVALAATKGFQWLRQRPADSEEPTTQLDAVPAPSEPSSATPIPVKPAPAPVTPEDDPALPLFTEAQALHGSGSLTTARSKAMEALDVASTAAMRRAIENLLGQVHSVLLFTPAPMEEKIDYSILPGDTLAVIARKHGVTLELLAKSNDIKGDIIRPGNRLRVVQGSFSVVVDKSANELTVYLNDRFFKRYPVGTGRYEKTPAGEFKVTDRIAQPTWYRPDGKVVPFGDKENELGTHWLSLDLPGYGIHGTWEPDTIGKQASAGCIRLLNQDIGELYALLPVGTPVVIKD